MRNTVIQTSCSRCDRVETLSAPPVSPSVQESPASATLGDISSQRPPAFFALLTPGGTPSDAGHKVSFEDLCAPCTRAVRALLQQVGKKIEGMSPDRKPREKKAAKTTQEKPVEKTHEKKTTVNGQPHIKS